MNTNNVDNLKIKTEVQKEIEFFINKNPSIERLIEILDLDTENAAIHLLDAK
ncbi:MAG: hypothetical protein HRT71_01045 [Flavobacteriales bacterium]|nr:hypothetical protein [Flavobacteriales bacterium]